ncbi:MAG: hypothetical protein NTU61_04870 [Candidatus Altiarchaeota archaeon]|nr:hypothetical protein [Candidatus Altiarchaeota archaeon]
MASAGAVVDNAITLVDIGGTKELILVVGVDGKGRLVKDRIFSQHEVRTPVGSVRTFYDKTTQAILETQKKAAGVRVIPIICVGSPGRFVDGMIQPGSAANLGNHPHEFDGVNPKKELEERLNAKVYVGNDAIAQMCHGIETLLEDKENREKLLGRKVCYAGPGTGTGGGFCRVGKDGGILVYTDGHIYDILVPGYDGKVKFPFECDGVKYKAELPYEKTKLEDLLSGRAIRQIACAIERKLIFKGAEPLFLPALPNYGTMHESELKLMLEHNNAESHVTAKFLRETFLQARMETGVIKRAKPVVRKIFEFEGLMLGKLIECVYTGRITKLRDDAQWSAADKSKVEGTRDYLIGGSVGTRGVGGKMIQESSLEYLKKKFPKTKFSLHPLIVETANAGAFGTFVFADHNEVIKQIKHRA